ncbi:MAG: translation initiation factor eIF-2B [Candidatus Nanoarchaeia archaeon]
MATLDRALLDTIKAIKELKIQGAETITETALLALSKAKNKTLAIKALRAARPTEPMLFNALDAVLAGADPLALIKKFKKDKATIAEFGSKLIKSGSVIFTHCHSSTVVNILKTAKNKGKVFEVHNTETRPLFQGRITAIELAKAGIHVCHFIDSEAALAMKDANLVLFGADWISPKGVANKIGSGAFARLASFYKIPVWICSHSWKFSEKQIKIESRPSSEVWPDAPRSICIHNSAFEIIDVKCIAGVVSELGILKWKDFIKTVRREKYGWL